MRLPRLIAFSLCAAVLLPGAANAQFLRPFDPSTQGYGDSPQQYMGRDRAAPRQYRQRRAAPEYLQEGPAPEYQAQVVDYATDEAPGTVIIDTGNKFLYYIMKNGLAIRYGVGVGKEGFGWTGTVEVGRKAEWPTWTPPAEMIKRRPELVEYSAGMPGGPDNPLGARALYLHDGGRDTMFRIHGTNEPWSIGHNVSSGCIRMLNEHVVELHRVVEIGAKVIVM
jgi:lipoprotein-anchoring transpeptidase ErfK/SrfK